MTVRTSVRDLAGLPYARFRRALDSKNATVALATATELDFVSLPDALELVLLLVDDPSGSGGRRSAGTPATAPKSRTSGSRRPTSSSRAWRAWLAEGRRRQRPRWPKLVRRERP